jgi:tRNA/rRNA methyltransferase
LLTQLQRDCISVVLVSPRNPLNIGAVARAMANFGFSSLTVVSAYEPHWREARSAVGSPQILQKAREVDTLAEAVRDRALVLGTGTLTHRKPEQPVVALPKLASLVNEKLEQGGKIAIVFGPEKHGLTRTDLSWCHALVQIPTDQTQPSMNLGQAVAVCLYELSVRAGHIDDTPLPPASGPASPPAVASGQIEVLASLIEEVMRAADYSPTHMHPANQHDLRLLLRRLHLNAADHRRILGLFRRILWRLKRNP